EARVRLAAARHDDPRRRRAGTDTPQVDELPWPDGEGDEVGGQRSGRFVVATATRPAGTRSVRSHGVLNPGSSKHGNARRAESDSNCVIEYHAPPSCWVKMPWVAFRACSASNASVRRWRPRGSGGSKETPTNCSNPLRIVARVSGSSVRGLVTAIESALSHSTSCG